MSRETVSCTREPFTLEIGVDELTEVNSCLMMFELNDFDSPNLWLTTDGKGGRVWTGIHFPSVLSVHTEGESPESIVFVPLPGTFLFRAQEIARTTGTCTLSLDTGLGVLHVKSGSSTYSIDYCVDAECYEEFLPTFCEPRSGNLVTATVSAFDFERFVDTFCYVPLDFKKDGKYPPHVALQVADSTLRATVDWRRFMGGRYTTSVECETVGTGSTSFYPYSVVTFLSHHAHDASTVTISFQENGKYLTISAGNWVTRTALERESAGRWGRPVRAALRNLGCEVEPLDGFQMPTVHAFSYEGCTFGAHIEPGILDVEDRVRISMSLGQGIVESIEIYREINAFNDRWSDVKLVLQESALYGVIDVPCMALERMGEAIVILQHRHTDLAPLLALYA